MGFEETVACAGLNRTRSAGIASASNRPVIAPSRRSISTSVSEVWSSKRVAGTVVSGLASIHLVRFRRSVCARRAL
jgi:hypothetical protein